jgi:hypothetical protein
MRLSAPKKATWTIAVIIAAVDLAAYLLARFNIVTVPVVVAHKYLFMLIAFALLWLGTFIKGL